MDGIYLAATMLGCVAVFGVVYFLFFEDASPESKPVPQSATMKPLSKKRRK